MNFMLGDPGCRFWTRHLRSQKPIPCKIKIL